MASNAVSAARERELKVIRKNIVRDIEAQREKLVEKGVPVKHLVFVYKNKDSGLGIWDYCESCFTDSILDNKGLVSDPVNKHNMEWLVVDGKDGKDEFEKMLDWSLRDNPEDAQEYRSMKWSKKDRCSKCSTPKQ
jgi:GrpB-like predicted nucleotidyltransferase (UPF0157 family)